MPVSARAFGLAAGAALALTAATSFAEEPCDRAAEPADTSPRASAKLAVGPGYRRLFSTWVLGADAELSLGRQTRLGAWYVNLGGLKGDTAYALSTTQGVLGGSWEFRAGAARFGLGGRATYVAIERATTGHAMTDWGVGVKGFASYDLVPFDGHAFYVAAAFTGDFMQGGQKPALWGPTADVGIRF